MTTAESWPATVPVAVNVACTSCQGRVSLECEGLGGTTRYETYNEYLCPYCRKLNHARTPGNIVEARCATAVA